MKMNCHTSSEKSLKSVSYFRPTVDIFEDEGSFKIVADVPGSSAENIDLDFEKNTLTLTARVQPRQTGSAESLRTEYQVGDFRRSLRFDESVDASQATATYEAGVLTVTLPKSESSRRRRVQVQSN